MNANKRSITANLKHPDGLAVVRALIAESDVFIENFAPGAMDRLGLGYEEVRKINPRIVYAQIKGFGEGSPYEKFLAFDTVAQSVGGSVSVTGEPDGRPLRPGFHLGDTGTGMQCVIGILAALYQRQFTGRGQRVRIAMQEAVMSFGRSSFAAGGLMGEAAHRHGNGTFAVSVPANLYRCKGDGANDYCYIYCSRAGNKHWESLLQVIGRPDLIGDPRFANSELRYEHKAVVDELILSWTLNYDKSTVMKALGDAGVPTGAVFDTSELINDPYLQRSGAVATVKHPARGDVLVPGLAVRLSDSSVPIKPAPSLGADTDDIYGKLLGMDASRLTELREAKAI